MPAIQNAKVTRACQNGNVAIQAKPVAADHAAADESVTVNPGKKFSGYQACTIM